MVQESPFSLYITLRKKFAIQTPGGNSNLDSDNQLILARDTIKILEDKLAHTESEFVKECNKVKVKREEFSEEIIILRESLKKSQTETNEKNKVISDLNKSAKAKDKELYNVEKKCNLATDTSKQLKDKVVQLKRDHSEAARSIKNKDKKGKIDKEKLEQKVKTLEQKLNSMNSNNNNTVKQVQSRHMYPYTLHHQLHVPSLYQLQVHTHQEARQHLLLQFQFLKQQLSPQ